MALSLVPENCFAENQAQRHFVDERFEDIDAPFGLREAAVHPSPEIAMAATAALDAEAERCAAAGSIVKTDFAGENSVRMRVREKPIQPFSLRELAKYER